MDSMRKAMAIWGLISLIGITGMTAAGPGLPQQDTAKGVNNELPKEDDRAVRKIIAGYEDAWNTHDMKAIASLFREDAQWINKVGMHWRGRDEMMVAHTAFHQTIFKNHKFQTDAVETRLIAPGVAVAVVTETFDGFTAPDGRVWPKARNRLSFVVVKGPVGWKIAHGQNSEVDEVAEKHDPVKNYRK